MPIWPENGSWKLKLLTCKLAQYVRKVCGFGIGGDVGWLKGTSNRTQCITLHVVRGAVSVVWLLRYYAPEVYLRYRCAVDVQKSIITNNIICMFMFGYKGCRTRSRGVGAVK